jgi:hypothetical protein
MTELKVPIVTIDADRPMENVFQEICYQLKSFLFKREEKIEQKLITQIPEEHLKNYEKSFVYKKSRYGDYSPMDLFTKNRTNPLLYRDRILYASN